MLSRWVRLLHRFLLFGFVFRILHFNEYKVVGLIEIGVRRLGFLGRGSWGCFRLGCRLGLVSLGFCVGRGMAGWLGFGVGGAVGGILAALGCWDGLGWFRLGFSLGKLNLGGRFGGRFGGPGYLLSLVFLLSGREVGTKRPKNISLVSLDLRGRGLTKLNRDKHPRPSSQSCKR